MYGLGINWAFSLRGSFEMPWAIFIGIRLTCNLKTMSEPCHLRRFNTLVEYVEMCHSSVCEKHAVMDVELSWFFQIAFRQFVDPSKSTSHPDHAYSTMMIMMINQIWDDTPCIDDVIKFFRVIDISGCNRSLTSSYSFGSILQWWNQRTRIHASSWHPNEDSGSVAQSGKKEY